MVCNTIRDLYTYYIPLSLKKSELLNVHDPHGEYYPVIEGSTKMMER